MTLDRQQPAARWNAFTANHISSGPISSGEVQQETNSQSASENGLPLTDFT
jgi:hypothetical protein